MGFGSRPMEAPKAPAHDIGAHQEQHQFEGSMSHPKHEQFHEDGTPHPHHGAEPGIEQHAPEGHGIHHTSLVGSAPPSGFSHGEPDEDDMPPGNKVGHLGGFKSFR